jgi:hypothetical protein
MNTRYEDVAMQTAASQQLGARAPGMVDTMAQEAAGLQSGIHQAASRLEDLADRLLGSVPQAVEKANEAQGGYAAGLHQLSAVIGGGHEALARLQRALNRFEAL